MVIDVCLEYDLQIFLGLGVNISVWAILLVGLMDQLTSSSQMIKEGLSENWIG